MRNSAGRSWRIIGALAASLALDGVPRAAAATYYFSQGGNDVSGLGTAARPWRSIDKFNSLDLRPGDSALFRAGDEFTGRMWLNESDSGVSSSGALIAPIKIGSYGATPAATRARFISPLNSEGFVALNAGGIELSDLDFVSGGFTSTRTQGIDFLSTKAKSSTLARLQHVRVSNVSASGFGLDGLRVWAHDSVGFADVQIRDSEFWNNGYSGVYVGATKHVVAQNKYHSDVLIERVVARDNPGFIGSLPITGHGVILANVDRGVVQDSVAHDNGKVNGNANVGIWTYESNSVVIQRNLAYGNRSPGGYDGGAFDIDGGVTNSIVQYNRSFDNDGAGLLLAQFDGANPMSKNIFRYNLSVNDGRGEFGGITVTGANSAEIAATAVFHNNTVVVDRATAPAAKGAVWFINGNHKDIDFIDNLFVGLNGAPLIAGNTQASKSTFLNNAYWTAGGPIVLEDQTYATVKQWAIAESQERLGQAYLLVTTDPQLTTDGTYRLTANSPLIDKARNPGLYPGPSWAANIGPRDLAGTPLPLGGAPDIGAWEFSPADFNGDGAVDGGDLLVWMNAMKAAPALVAGGSTPLAVSSADSNHDGRVDGRDFLNWQLGVRRPQAQSANVPEPPTLAVGAAVMLAARFARRRRRPPTLRSRTPATREPAAVGYFAAASD
jgi:hypothetical protein